MFIQQQNIIDKRTHLRWQQGLLQFGNPSYLDEVDGANGRFLTSEPVYGGQHFYLRVKEGYKVAYVVMYDRATHKRASQTSGWSPRFYPNGEALDAATPSRDTLTNPGITYSARTWIPADMYVRICVCADDVAATVGKEGGFVTSYSATGSTIAPTDEVVEVFYLFDTVLFQPDTAGRPAAYGMAKRVARQANAVSLHNRLATKNSGGWVGSDKDNSHLVGIPYVAVSAQRRGSVSMFAPSMETYLSLWHNRRSLMYTEKPMASSGSPSVSEYGIDWDETDSRVHQYGRLAYGMVCNCAASSVFGMPEHTNETVWGTTDPNYDFMKVVYPSLAKMAANNGADLRPLDVAYSSGNHVFVVTDVYRRGADTFVEVFESSTNCTLTLTTPQQLCSRCTNEGRNFVFVRPLANFYKRVGHYDFAECRALPTGAREWGRYVPNDDICTFAGDKATFACGDPVWLNVRQTNGATGATFDSIRLYRKEGESYTLVQTLTMATPASGHRKTFTADGTNDVVWDIDVTTIFATGTLTGLLQARAYNSGTQAESAPVSFEVIDVNRITAWPIGTTKGLLVHVEDVGAIGGRRAFVQALSAHYAYETNDYANHAHYHVPLGSEGKYGIMYANAMTAEVGKKCQLCVKGEYGYAVRTVDLAGSSARTNYIGSTSGFTQKRIAWGGSFVGDSSYDTYVKEVTESMRGKTYKLVFDDTKRPNFHMIAAQYDSSAGSASGIGAASLIKQHIVRPKCGEPTGETRVVDIKVDDNCAYLAISSVKEDGRPVVRNLVSLPFDPVLPSDEGFDYYVGCLDYNPETYMLEDWSAASLLAYAQGHNVSDEPEFVRTVGGSEAGEAGLNQLVYLLYKDGCEPASGRYAGEAGDINWSAESFAGVGSRAWIIYGNKTVTIGGTPYHVVGFVGNFDEGDKFIINFAN